MKYVGTEVEVNDLTGNITLINEHVEINTSSIQEYMDDLGYYFLGNYDGLVYTKANFNQNTYRRVFIQEVGD